MIERTINRIEITAFFRKKISLILVFGEQGLSIEKPLSFDPVLTIDADQIVAFRYGINWISGYQFNIGRQYIVEILDERGQIFPVKLRSMYGIRRNIYYSKWSDIVAALWHFYFRQLFEMRFQQYRYKERFDFAGVEFHPFGIKFDEYSLFWNEIRLSNYKSYFVVHHYEDLKKRKSFNFKNDWNASLLQVLLKEIKREQDRLSVSDN